MSISTLIDSIETEISRVRGVLDRLEAARDALAGGKKDVVLAAAGPVVQQRRRGRKAKPDRAMPDQGKQIIDYLSTVTNGADGVTASQIANGTGLPRNSVSTKLVKMARAGEIKKAKRGYTV